MKVIKINGIEYKYYTSFDSMPVKEYLRICEGIEKMNKDSQSEYIFDTTEFVSIVLDIAYDIAIDAPDFIYNDIEYILTKNVINDSKFKIKKINVDGKIISISDDILKQNKEHQLTIGQLSEFRQVYTNIERKYLTIEKRNALEKYVNKQDMTDNETQIVNNYATDMMKALIKKMSYLSALILCTDYYDEKFSIDNAKSLESKLNEMPVAQIWPIAFFLIVKFAGWLIYNLNSSAEKELLHIYKLLLQNKMKISDIVNVPIQI